MSRRNPGELGSQAEQTIDCPKGLLRSSACTGRVLFAHLTNIRTVARLLSALMILVIYCLFELIVGLRVLLYIFRRKTDPVRSRLSRVLGEDA